MASIRTARPLLENGDRMTREEFHRRYSQCEDLHRVELIEGVVYMPSPIRDAGHSREQTVAILWLATYALGRDAVEARAPATVLLDDDNEPEPDALLYRARPGRIDDDGYLVGAPELVVEIAGSSVSRDLHQKKAAYERNGVLEYIVWRTDDAAIDWFQLREGAYVLRTPGDDGIIESEVFPGLRLDVAKMLGCDSAGVLAELR